MKRMFLFSTLMLVILTSHAFAIFKVMDSFAAEALLNKPDIIQNLDFMKQAHNVTVQEPGVSYRSHYDERVIVILEDVQCDEFLKGLSVRMQIPMEEKITPFVHSLVSIRDAGIDDIGEDFLKSLGYEVDIFGMGAIVDDDFRDPPAGNRPVDENLPDLPNRDEAEVKPDAAEVASAEMPPGLPPAEEPPEASAIRSQSINLSKGDVRLIIVPYKNVEVSGVDFIVNIMNSQSMSDDVREDIRRIAAFYGFEGNILDQLDKNLSVLREMDLVESVDIDRNEFDFRSAMKVELEWLKANGVIMGISDEDITEISSIMKTGMAGRNSRIIYSEGKWIPYYKTVDVFIMETIEEGRNNDMNDVPPGVPVFPVSSVSPKDKLSTKWGKVKSNI